MAKTSPKSIRDTDSVQAARSRKARATRGRRVRTVALAAAIAAGVGGAGYGAYVLVGPGSSEGSDLRVAEPTAEVTSVQVLMDGWSLATLADRTVTARWAGGDAARVNFEPVTAADLAELLKTSPGLVQAAYARQLDGSVALSCDTGGCTIDGKRISVDDLLLRGSSDAQKLLRGHGIESGLLKARVAVPDGKDILTISADGYAGIELAVAGAFSAQDTAEAEALEPSLANGFQQGRWLVSAGLGQMFVPDAAWLGAPEERAAVFNPISGTTPDGSAQMVAAQAPAVVAATGLATPLAAAADWSASQLTLATSPSKGCAAGVLCYPGTLEVAQETSGPQFVTVSSESSDGAIVFDDRTARMTLPAPITQAGLEGQLEGTVSVRFVTVALFAGAGLPAVDWAGMVSVDDDAPYSPADALGAVRLAGQQWTATS